MTEAETIARDEVAEKNRNALVAVLNETGALISPLAFAKWRPTQRTRGVIPGMPVAVTCVATDGNLGIFIPCYTEGHNLGSSFLGHIHRFQWESEKISKFQVEDKETGKSKQVTVVRNSGAPPPLYSLSMGDQKPKRTKKKPSRKEILDNL